ncbi:unnamed protein product [Echinostoma caproni]|uniref:CSD_1 domain-containing protein n=1 Tax=Echinostoma caproni TaxID=27848 RepID=A0A183BFR7_9TREM|nr:unnamed protein product [Echinostoma caproni]
MDSTPVHFPTVRGHVKWYSASRHYGFISRNDDGGDLFVHRSVISAYSKRFPSLRTGEEVEFSVVETNQGIEATYVTGPGGQPVKVSCWVYECLGLAYCGSETLTTLRILGKFRNTSVLHSTVNCDCSSSYRSNSDAKV